MNKKVFYFLCGVAACSVLTACSGQEASPTAASVSQSAAASESVSVSESVSSVTESVSSVVESMSSSSGDGTDLTTEYNPEGTAKEFTAEEAAIYGDIEALHERQYQETFEETYGMSPEEFDNLTGDEIADLRRELIAQGKLPKGGVG